MEKYRFIAAFPVAMEMTVEVTIALEKAGGVLHRVISLRIR